MKFDEASELVESGAVLHIAGTEGLLRKLPKGKWIGGSTEYFMGSSGGKVSDELLFVTKFPYEVFFVKNYDTSNICDVAADTFDHGFSILIIPFDSKVHREYAQNAPKFKDMFLKHITGWISGVNLSKPGQVPIVINGVTGEAFSDKAVALHLDVPGKKMISVNIVNIFEQDESSPVIKFNKEGFSVNECLVNGKETVFADYVKQNGIDTKLPLVGNYSGAGVNISIKSIEGNVVNLYAPVFEGIEYRIAKNIPDYGLAFHKRIEGINLANTVFSCNCILNFLYGELEGKSIEISGPITFGEIAYQLVNQTFVYVTIQ
jgi:hypothetical protein